MFEISIKCISIYVSTTFYNIKHNNHSFSSNKNHIKTFELIGLNVLRYLALIVSIFRDT